MPRRKITRRVHIVEVVKEILGYMAEGTSYSLALRKANISDVTARKCAIGSDPQIKAARERAKVGNKYKYSYYAGYEGVNIGYRGAGTFVGTPRRRYKSLQEK